MRAAVSSCRRARPGSRPSTATDGMDDRRTDADVSRQRASTGLDPATSLDTELYRRPITESADTPTPRILLGGGGSAEQRAPPPAAYRNGSGGAPALTLPQRRASRRPNTFSSPWHSVVLPATGDSAGRGRRPPGSLRNLGRYNCGLRGSRHPAAGTGGCVSAGLATAAVPASPGSRLPRRGRGTAAGWPAMPDMRQTGRCHAKHDGNAESTILVMVVPGRWQDPEQYVAVGAGVP